MRLPSGRWAWLADSSPAAGRLRYRQAAGRFRQVLGRLPTNPGAKAPYVHILFSHQPKPTVNVSRTLSLRYLTGFLDFVTMFFYFFTTTLLSFGMRVPSAKRGLGATRCCSKAYHKAASTTRGVIP